MTPHILSILRRLDRIGYHPLYYRRSIIHIAGIGCKDLTWAKHVLRRAGA